MSRFTQAYGALKLALDTNKPTILVVGGVISMGVGAIYACKQTMKFEETINPHLHQLEQIQDAVENQAPLAKGGHYTPEHGQGDRKIAYSRMAVDSVKLYWVPVILFTGGAVMVFRGHHILQQRNAALAVAFTTLKKSFDAYRARVVDLQGHEADQGYMNGSKTAHLQIDGKDVVAETRDWDADENDIYNRVFSQQTSSQWQPDLGSNRHFVATRQEWANHVLNRNGYLYLSEVYESLGLAQSDVSRVVGWRVDIDQNGDRNVPHVDFGINKPIADDWKYNRRNEVYLDFNCTGLIVGGKIRKALEKG